MLAKTLPRGRASGGHASPNRRCYVSRIITGWIPGAWIVLAVLVAAQLHAQGRGGRTPDSASVERGTGLYSANCSFCHGTGGRGSAQAPSLARNQLLSPDRAAETLATIREGRPSRGMPAFSGLSEQNLSDILAYLRTQARQARGMLPETALLAGNAEAGKAYFNGDGRCGACHSATGDLAHIGSKYTPLPLTVAFLTPTPTKPVEVKVTLPSGQTISGTLRYLDGFAVSLTDSSGEYHSWYRENVKAVDVSDPLAAHRAQLARYSDKDIHDLVAYLVTLK